jgi:hypothetical protein
MVASEVASESASLENNGHFYPTGYPLSVCAVSENRKWLVSLMKLS